MKKNWVQIVSLTLNVVLLVCLVFLGGKVENLHAETMSRLNQIGSDVDVIQERVSAIRETQREQTEFIEDFRFVPIGVNTETKTLDGSMELPLRRWSDDTTVELLATVGDELWTFPMTEIIEGVFAAAVTLPLDGDGKLRFEAAVTMQGVTQREDVTGYESLSMLLPLRYVGGGYGGPEYQDGVLELYTYSVTLERQYGAKVVDPVLQILKNGTVVQEWTAEPAKLTYDATRDIVDYALNDTLQVECAEGDTVEIRLVCQDSLGLSYDFFSCGWTLNEEGVTESVYPGGDHSVQISWNN